MTFGFAFVVPVILIAADGSFDEATIEADGGLLPQRIVNDTGCQFKQVDQTDEDVKARRFRWVECAPDEYLHE